MSGAEKQPRAKRTTPKARDPNGRVLLKIQPDGSFRAADAFSSKRLSTRGYKRGQEVVAYVSRVRDGRQWRRAHVLGQFLVDNVGAFDGKDAHQAIKKVQLDGKIACTEERFDLPGGLGQFVRIVPESLAFGEMDDIVFTPIYAQMRKYIGDTYFGDMDATAVDEMLNVMERDGGVE